MFSYKKIDMLNLTVEDNFVYYNNEILIIKSPIINYELKDDELMLKINGDSDCHIIFLNLCSYIERLFKNLKIKINIITNRNDIINRSVKILINKNSKFYDTDREEMFKNNVKSLGKVICSFSVENGNLILHEMLQIK